MLIKNIEQRIKINKIISISTIAFAVFIVIAGFLFAYRMIEDSRKSIYILDNGVPVLAKDAAIFLPIIPDLPIPVTITLPLQARIIFIA